MGKITSDKDGMTNITEQKLKRKNMNEFTISDYINNRYAEQVDWYDKKSILNKRLTYLLQIPVLVLAAVTPIFATLEYSTITILSSAFVAAGLAVISFCKFEALWHSYRTTCETLKKEKVHHDMLTDVYANAENADKLFVERVEAVISKEHTSWRETVSKTEKKGVVGLGGR